MHKDGGSYWKFTTNLRQVIPHVAVLRVDDLRLPHPDQMAEGLVLVDQAKFCFN